jgi:4,5-dihydroxyphthalate decarboxylase
MHLVGVRRELAERHPWLPAAVLKAFSAAKDAALRHLSDTAATKATLPFVEEQLAAARALMGPDFWSYGMAPNRHVLDAFLRHHHEQGLSPRLLGAGDLFHPSTHETVKV